MRHASQVDPNEPPTCPSCGALVGREQDRCRRCKRWLRGNAVEGVIYSALLPVALRRWTGTARLFTLIVLYFLIGGLLTRGEGLLTLSSYSLRQLGAMNGPDVLLGEYWRAVSSIFVHHDIIHLAFNLLALAIAGPVVERFYGRWTLSAVFVFAGAGSMLVSHLWYLFAGGPTGLLYTSGGASGAISALIGAAWAAAGRLPGEADTRKRMLVWSIWMLIIGFGFAGAINNAAHIGGWVLGAAWARFGRRPFAETPQEPTVARVTGAAALFIAGVALVISTASAIKGPAMLENDGTPRGIFGFTVFEGRDWAASDQVRFVQDCATVYLDGRKDREAQAICRRATEATPHVSSAWQMRAAVEEDTASERRIRRYLWLSERLF